MSEKVAIYCRLSEEDRNKQHSRDDSCSIQNQKAMLRDYAEGMGWEIFGVYSDDDYTGSDRNRPQFNRLLEDARAKRFDIILCKTQSRFTRELELVERYIHGLFPLWGIRFVSIVDNADTANKGNKKARQINGLVNEWYLEDLSDSIKSALDTRRKNGFHIGSFALYGYRKDPERKGHLLIDEEASAVVQEVFSLFAKGYGKTAIARMLNDRGIPNPTEYKRLQGLRFKHPPSKNSTLWKYSAISDMLTNETYIGNLVQGRYESISYKTSQTRSRPREQWLRVEGTHQPIIDRALWDRVQSMLARRAKPFAIGTVGLFAGKARCASCGYALRSSKSGDRHFLTCPTKYYDKTACEGAFISVDRLERILVDELNRLSADHLDKNELARKINFHSDLLARKERIEAVFSSQRAQIEQASFCLRNLYLDKIRGILSESDFLELSKDFTAQRDRLQAEQADCEQELVAIEEQLSSTGDTMELIEQYVAVRHLSREAVEILVDKITVGKRISGTRNVPVEIYWNF